ncbi:MAG: hypothetical protein JOZ72_06410 [Alphaproteobacteria bacterium]|nr:hypothetical protein [Alphaproteobacteria bacterium]
MKNIRLALLGTACALALCGPAHAVQQNVVEVDAVDGVSSLNLNLYSAFHAASYHCAAAPCPADGGEGLFTKNGTSCTPDGGSIVKDMNNNCFYRQNLNGDLRQFGVVKSSLFNCEPSPAGHGTSCTPITSTTSTPVNPIAALLAAAGTAGLHRITTAGVQVRIDSTLTIPSGMELDLGGASPFGNRSDLLSVPGTIFLDRGTQVVMSDHTFVHNGILLPSWYAAPHSINDLYTIVQNMKSYGDTGLNCGSSGCVIRDMEVDGFDTAVQIANAPYNFMSNTVADGNVCYWISSTGGSPKWLNTECQPKMTRQSYNQRYYQVTNVAAASGVCRLTVTPMSGMGTPDPVELTNGYMAWVSGMNKNGIATGGATANGRWTLTNVSYNAGTHTATVDLDTSECNGANLSLTTRTAQYTIGSKKLTNVSNMANIRVGETFTSADFTGTVTVTAVWPNKSIVFVDKAANVTRSSATNVTFDGGAFTTAPACDTMGAGTCIVLDAAARIDAGDSDGGKASGNGMAGSGIGHATAYMIGGWGTNDAVAGLSMLQPQAYAHSIDYHIHASNNTRITGPKGDSDGNYDDPFTIFVKMDGDSNNASLMGGGGSKSGVGLMVDNHDDTQCLSYVAASAETGYSGYPIFEVDNGCLMATGIRPGGGPGFIANSAGVVNISGSELANTSIYYEGNGAQGITTTLGSRLDSGQNNLMNSNLDNAHSPPDGTDLQIVQGDALAGRVVQDTFGGLAEFDGRRANGGSKTQSALLNGDTIAALGAFGYDGSSYSGDSVGGVSVTACENWSNSANCAATALSATEAGTKNKTEVARAESAGFGINSGTGVAAQLEVVSTSASTTLNGTMNNSSTAAITVGSTTGFPSPGTMLIDGEAISYKVTGPTTITPIARGVWGTTAAGHANNAVISYFSELKGNPASPRLDFATDTLGDMWWRGHLLSGGSAPALSGGGLGGSPSVAGNDNAGRITVGSAPSATAFTITFAQPWPNAPVCFAQDESNTAKNPIIATFVSTTSVTFSAAANPAAGNKISYSCVGFR